MFIYITCSDYCGWKESLKEWQKIRLVLSGGTQEDDNEATQMQGGNTGT